MRTWTAVVHIDIESDDPQATAIEVESELWGKLDERFGEGNFQILHVQEDGASEPVRPARPGPTGREFA